jgi:uncharacterized protein YegL
MTTIPVILKVEPVSRFDLAASRTRQPHVAVVYATGNGIVDVIDGGKPMRFSDQMSGRFRYRYEVDMSDHHRTVELRSSPPPAKGGVYHFTALVNIGFRVCDPAQVVRRNIRDALRVVCDHLMFAYRNVTVNFAVEAAKRAEDAVNALFQGSTTIESCIELFLCRARLAPDPDAASYLRAEQHARDRNVVRDAQHVLEADEARRRNAVELIRQRGSLERRAREREALDGRPFDMQDLLALHIERHPDATEEALRIAAEIRDKDATHADAIDRRGWEKFQFMTERNLLQAIDVDQIRDQMLSDVSRRLTPMPAGPAVDSWDDPLPGDEQHSALPGLIPVYLAVDESLAPTPSINAISDGVREILHVVASQPEIARLVRLGVLGYAGDATVRLPLQEVRPDLPVPAFIARSGRVRLAALFDQLRECIRNDVEALRAQTPSLRRPQVLLLSGGLPVEDRSWVGAHRALVDRDSQQSAPDIIACGVADANPQILVDIATRPELAFVAEHQDIDASLENFCAFVRRRVFEYGRAVVDGDQHALITGPEGFRPAAELTASSSQGS